MSIFSQAYNFVLCLSVILYSWENYRVTRIFSMDYNNLIVFCTHYSFRTNSKHAKLRARFCLMWLNSRHPQLLFWTLSLKNLKIIKLGEFLTPSTGGLIPPIFAQHLTWQPPNSSQNVLNVAFTVLSWSMTLEAYPVLTPTLKSTHTPAIKW